MKRTLQFAAALLAGSLGCTDGETVLQRERIFVDEEAVAAAGGELPVETIGAETRYVFRGHPSAHVVALFGTQIPADERFERRVRLPESLGAPSRVVTDGRFQRRGRSHPIPWKVRAVEPDGQQLTLEVDLAFPPKSAGERVPVLVQATALPESDRSSYQTEAVRIPPAARLEFGYGVLELARDQGPVEFLLEVCSDGSCDELFRSTLDPLEPSEEGGPGWRDEAVSLSRWAGREASLRLSTTRLRGDAGGFTLPVWSTPILYTTGLRRDGDVNLILISLDTLRADHLNSYGYPLETAPFLEEAFGERGTVVEHLEAAAATTAPAHMTAFTGLNPSAHGVKAGQLRKLVPGAVTLAEQFRAHGFRTGAVTENAALIIDRGFARGFDAYLEDKSPTVFLPRGQIERTLRRARSWLERDRDKRFFLFLHTYQVHYPYAPPPEYAQLFPELPDAGKPPASLPPEFDPRLYDREIRFTDDRLREFYTVLEELGLAENTIVIVTSDHGEEFGEHGFIGHGPTLFSEVTHVPLMLRGPGIPEGRRVAGPFGQIGLAPTLLDLAGVPPLPSAEGKSFAPALLGQEPELEAPEPLFSESWVPSGLALDLSRQPRSIPALAVRLGDRRLVRYGQGAGTHYHYFDLSRDPLEQRDLYPEQAAEAADLRALLDAYLSRREAERAELELGAAAPAADAPLPYQIDPDQAAKLRALGYVD